MDRLISEQEVLDVIASWFESTEQQRILQGRIKAIPSAEPKWILCSERLPQKDESVLLTICANSSLYGFNENFVKVMCGSYSPCEDERDWIVNEVRYYIDNVIAWMPLPEPYKAERE